VTAEVSALVLGRGGLLGSAIARGFRDRGGVLETRGPIDWRDGRADSDIASLVDRWSRVDAERYELYWTAGVAVISTPAEQVAIEVERFNRMLVSLQQAVESRGIADRVAVFLASSAGGVYSGAPGAPYDELSSVAPVGAYGAGKVAQEQDLAAVTTRLGIRSIAGRISTLYGAGQNLAKPQGFIAQLCSAQLRRQPMSVYVSLDTKRDYLHVDDAACLVAAGMRHLQREPRGAAVVKNLASEHSTTIGHVLHQAGLVFKRRPSVVYSASPLAASQILDLRMGSVVWPEMRAIPRRSLLVGIHQTKLGMEQVMRLPSTVRTKA
jgi:UDP-glucose 4-epimerase